jgi:hypothetical protein
MTGGSDKTRVHGRRPIDMRRNAGGVIEIGTNEDGPIVAFVATDHKLYCVKTRAIYGFQFADQIDPDRQNPEIPNIQQKELSIGSEDADVARILLTAELLLKTTALGQSFDVKRGVQLALDVLKDIAALREKREKLELDQNEAITKYGEQGRVQATRCLPSIQNIEAQCDAFAQKAAHVVNGLENVAKLFYPTVTSKWIDSLIRTVKQTHGDQASFSLYLNRIRPFLLFVLDDFRNLIEHPKPDKFIKVHNFRLLPTGQLVVPSVEIVRPGQSVESDVITELMKSVTDDLVNVCEAFFVYLCGSNIQVSGAFSSLGVIKVAPEQRHNPNIRFSYGYYNGQRMVPVAVG